MLSARAFADHIQRVQRQFGRRTVLGNKAFIVKGYLSNVLQIDSPHEKELDRVIARVLQAPGAFIDVGMNLGQTLGKVLAVDPDRAYIGFEPQVLPCTLVAQFIRENGLANCRVFPFGLSDMDGIVSFFSNGDADVMGSMFPDGPRKSVTHVPVRVGDDVLSALGVDRICGLKIDVEGAELEVMRGLSGTLRRFGPPLIFEVLPNFSGAERTPISEAVAAERTERARKIFDFLTLTHGYEIFQIMANSEERPIPEFDLDTPAEFHGANYIARKGSQTNRPMYA